MESLQAHLVYTLTWPDQPIDPPFPDSGDDHETVSIGVLWVLPSKPISKSTSSSENEKSSAKIEKSMSDKSTSGSDPDDEDEAKHAVVGAASRHMSVSVSSKLSLPFTWSLLFDILRLDLTGEEEEISWLLSIV